MISRSPQETKKIVASLAKTLKNPQTLALYGNLGSGKTTFVQFLAESLGVKARVTSPTFVLLRSYWLENKPWSSLHHFDLYRTKSLADAQTTGISEILKEENVLVAIEWPEVIEDLLPASTLRIHLKNLGGETREIEIN